MFLLLLRKYLVFSKYLCTVFRGCWKFYVFKGKGNKLFMVGNLVFGL